METTSKPPTKRPPRRVRVFGVAFLDADVGTAVNSVREGGLLVAPSGPGLAEINEDEVYREALLGSDVVIADSGLMVLLLRRFKGVGIRRVSGLVFLKEFLKLPELREPGALFMVNPTEEEAGANREYLEGELKIPVPPDCDYTAPFYPGGAVEDERLLEILREKRPRFVLLNIAGGKQEKLGLYLKRNLDYLPAIVCTGAAIAFLTGRQASIPLWADRLYLGWLLRCLHQPRKFVPRYVRSAKLTSLIVRRKIEIEVLEEPAPGENAVR